MADENENDGGILSNRAFLMSLWVFFFFLFACAPLCINRYKRELWWKRITSCRWTVDVEPEPEPEWHRVMRQRYEAYQARVTTLSREGQLTLEEEDEIRQMFLLERMAAFTYSLKDADIRHKLDNSTGRPQSIGDSSTHSLHVSQKTVSASEERAQVTTCQESDVCMEGVDCVPTLKTDDNPVDDSSDEEMGIVEMPIIEESDMLVRVPIEGQPLQSGGKTRWIQNGCAICLAGFEAGDRVVWSATAGDPHVFHEDCMAKYFLAVGSKASRRRRLSSQTEPTNVQNPVEAATDFPMLCPCCRQQYINEASVKIPSTCDDESDNAPRAEEVQAENVVISESSNQYDLMVEAPSH